MTYSNTVGIVSNREQAAREVKSMLVLLRDIDKVECYDYYKAQETFDRKAPGVIILHMEQDTQQCIRLLKRIRKNDDTKDTPVIIYGDSLTPDSVVEVFDLGATDVISAPLKDYELVIRVIWAIRKGELVTLNNAKDSFLKELGIIDEETGFYKEEYGKKYLEAVVSKVKDPLHYACLALIKGESGTDCDALAELLKASIRLNDVVTIKSRDSYYLFLSKVKLSGFYSVYERICSRLKPNSSIRACVAEIQDDDVSEVIVTLNRAMEDISKKGEVTVVKEDFFGRIEEGGEDLDIASILAEEPEYDEKEFEDTEEDSEIEDEDEIFDEFDKEDNEEVKEEEGKEDKYDSTEFDNKTKEYDLEAEVAKMTIYNDEGEPVRFDLKPFKEEIKAPKGLKNMRKAKEEQRAAEIKAKFLPREEILTNDERDVDKRNAVVYKQAYANKLNVVVKPLLKKYASRLQTENPGLTANFGIDQTISYLKLEKNDVKLSFEMMYDEIKKINFSLAIFALSTEIESDRFEMEVMEFDHQKLDVILKTITDEYLNYLTEN